MPAKILTEPSLTSPRRLGGVTSSRVAAGLLILAVLRILLLFALPLDLSGDEAYYWEWGQHLDWGYFSKPPGIGWLMGLASWMGLDGAPAIRSVAVVLGTGTAWFLFRLGERIYDVRVGLLAVLIFLATPANAGLNAILTIDAPLMFCWAGALYGFWRLRETGFRGVGWAVALALALAGGLLSKQMMLVFYPLALMSLALRREDRMYLRSPILWGALLISLLALLPPIWWNEKHEWATVRHTMHHFSPSSFSLGAVAARSFDFLLAQAIVATPFLWGLMIVALVRAARTWKRLGAGEQFLLLLSAPGLITIFVLTVRQRVNANWPAVFYASAVILLAGWACARWDAQPSRLRRYFPAALWIGAGLTVLMYFAVISLAYGWVPAGNLELATRVRGWSELAREVDRERAAAGESNPLVITQSHRFLTSELAFYLKGHPRVYRFHPDAGLESQHDFWAGPPTGEGRDAIIVVQGKRQDVSPGLVDNFMTVTFLREMYQGKETPQYSLFLGRNLLTWP